MKLVDVLLLSLTVFFIIIGAYETMTIGVGAAYGKIMAAVGLFFFYNYRKKK